MDVFFGDARFAATDAVTVDGARLRFGKAMIATGARPDTPSIPGLVEAGFLTNENVFDLTEATTPPVGHRRRPPRLRTGAGLLPLRRANHNCARYPALPPQEERDAAQTLSDAFARDGIEVRLNTAAVRVRVEGAQKLVDLVSDDYQSTVAVVDAILTGTGRLPNVEELNLEVAGVDCDPATGIRVTISCRPAIRGFMPPARRSPGASVHQYCGRVRPHRDS